MPKMVENEKEVAKRIAKRIVRTVTANPDETTPELNSKTRKRIQWRLQQIIQDEIDIINEASEGSEISLEGLRELLRRDDDKNGEDSDC